MRKYSYERMKAKKEARRTWAKHNGPIPPGMHIHHKDRNRFNNDISNLEMLTAYDHWKEHHDRWIETGEVKEVLAANALAGYFKVGKVETGFKGMEGENNPFYGKTHSDWTKENTNMSKHWYKGKVVLDTETGVYYDSIKEAAEAHNINVTTLQDWLGRSSHNNKTSLIKV